MIAVEDGNIITYMSLPNLILYTQSESLTLERKEAKTNDCYYCC